MLAIVLFLLLHWYACIFAQSFFLHRSAAHKMFRMSKFWERFFYAFTWIAQGSSFLNPRAYAILHLEHHKHSDTEHDPHSPSFFKDVVSMMLHTRRIFHSIKRGDHRSVKYAQEKKYPEWPFVDSLGDNWATRLAFCGLYFVFYYAFAPNVYWYALLPVHFLMGPIHGAFVNWCGHKYGYSNYDNKDHSKNTFAWDVIFMGECFQNNHHRFPRSSNFAKKWFEFDGLYPFLRLLNRLKVIKLIS